jgi:hypothetical protein
LAKFKIKAFDIIMFRKTAKGLASLEPPIPFIAWRKELREMAGDLRSANPLATSGPCQPERISDNHDNIGGLKFGNMALNFEIT